MSATITTSNESNYGIDFHNPMISKPANLHNSAVLRMLEEEENRQRNGLTPGSTNGSKPLREWPPPGATNTSRKFNDIVVSGTKRVAWPPPKEGDDFSEQPAAQTQNSEPTYQPQQYQQPTRQVEPPPTTITLRSSVPTRQAPAPVFNSQPATATLKGGKNLRGDMKWPPENVRERMQTEKQALMDLAKGPACRPKRVSKNYQTFFDQHALNSTYPGYKVPPGTQFYDHHPVW